MAEAPAYDGFLAERLAPIVLAAQEQFKFSHILAGSSAISRSVLPRVAAKLDVSPISDIIGVKDAETFVRYDLSRMEANKYVLVHMLVILLTHIVY